MARILEVWNIRSDDVVFVDDNALELAEMKAVYPAIECIEFFLNVDHDIVKDKIVVDRRGVW
jgi:predicted enzyme involved in methoxymalonyl-ACP biosynthesis